ncbi:MULTISPECIES: ATP-binding protein [Streptacidiphilus]|uniref:ATP-binding protein n=1 Tax=Streptacidiphilus cavernicola TaxID=3342716 RepID=A0ABV6UW45_9ACTN|nr:ATP-binding protein [Streptacidiphilus jeojiense]
MRVPMRHVVDNLIWTVHGTVWAVYQVTPVASRFVPARTRRELVGRLTSMVRQLSGSPRWFGLCAQVDEGEVVARMVEGVDLGQRPAWEEVADASLSMLWGAEMYRRTHWLAIPLRAPSAVAELQATVASAWSEVGDLLGLAPGRVSAGEVDAYRRRAQNLSAQLAGGPVLRPAKAAEIVWMVQHAVHRGLEEPLLVAAQAATTGGGRVVGDTLHSPSYQGLGQVRLAEGGQLGAAATPDKDGSRAWWKRRDGTSPVLRRWLEVESEQGCSYQAHLVIGQQPGTVVAQAADVLAQLEALPFPVDYVVDLQIVPAEKAKVSVRRKKRELVDQAEQYGAETSGLPEAMFSAAGELGEESARLEQTASEVEVQAVTALTVWADTPSMCEQRARTLAGALEGGDYQVIRPIGGQESLFALGLPGAPAAPRLREFRQVELSEDWAMRGAGTSIDLGDAVGALAGFSMDCGTARPVLIDLAGAPNRDVSASMGVVGELGSGKSVFEKALSSAVVDRGGQAIVVDRTPLREWAAFATAATAGRAQIVDAAAAAVSIDPLRLFPAGDGTRWAMSYLTLQLGVGPMTPAGALLSHVVQKVAAGSDPSMHAVLTMLEAMAADSDVPGVRGEHAATLADMLRIVAQDRLGAMVFDPGLPPLRWQDLDGDMVVVTTAGLTLPSTAALAKPELLRQQPLEALIGRAVLYLVAAVARQVAFTDPSRFCLIALDECYWLTASTEGAQLVHEIVHDGRKHKAGVLLGSHDPEELGSETTRGLLGYKVLMRHTDPVLARRGLTFLGLDDTDTLLQDEVTGLSPRNQDDRKGECLLRDSSGRTGRMRVMIPPVARIRAKIHTTPSGPAPLRAATRPQELPPAGASLAKAKQVQGGGR